VFSTAQFALSQGPKILVTAVLAIRMDNNPKNNYYFEEL
jgi:hypothetical protein